jgi:hypothetical protein
MKASGFADFDRLTDLFVRARDVLERVARAEELSPESTAFLAGAVLPHVELVEEGFRISLRAGGVDRAELRWLVSAAGVGRDLPADVAEHRAARLERSLERRLDKPRVRRPNGGELAAIAHARLVFALLPRLPGEVARWPHRWPHPDYRDVDPPRRPAELAVRIEELERQVWWTAAGRPALSDPAYRRTFGFFDTAAWLGSQIFGLPA